MASKWLGVGIGMGLATIAWLGCGGSSDETTPAAAQPDGGGASTSAEAGGPSDAGAGGSLKDVTFDGNVEAPEVAIKFGSCGAFAACGGNEVGRWTVTGGCLDDAFLAETKAACPEFKTSNESIKARGLLEADGTNVARQMQAKLTANAFFPLSCSPIPSCKAIEFFAKSQLGFEEATCTDSDAGAGCDCTVSDTIVEQSVGTYTKSGSTITTGSGDTFDYCVSGSKLSTTQTNGDGFKFFLDLAK